MEPSEVAQSIVVLPLVNVRSQDYGPVQETRNGKACRLVRDADGVVHKVTVQRIEEVEMKSLVDRLDAMQQRMDWRGFEVELRDLLAKSAFKIEESEESEFGKGPKFPATAIRFDAYGLVDEPEDAVVTLTVKDINRALTANRNASLQQAVYNIGTIVRPGT